MNQPEQEANLYDEGTIEFGKDSQRWVVKKTENGKEWVPLYSTSLFGFRHLTAKILEENINTPITVYERQSQSFWPKSLDDFDIKYDFAASGDAEFVKDKQVFENWLRTRTPAVKEGQYVILKGELTSNDIEAGIQVGTFPDELVSSNLMNTDAYIVDGE
jgi:hypothetical protein